VALDECTESCQRQDFLYQQWEDEEKQDRFDDHKACLKDASCDEITNGVCYDDALFVF